MPSSTPRCIVRNFQRVNAFPDLPILCCLRIAGPEDDILITRAIKRKTGDNSARANADVIMSTILFHLGTGGAETAATCFGLSCMLPLQCSRSFHIADDSRRAANDNGIGRHIFSDNTACTDYGVFPDRDTAQNDASAPY